LYPFTPRLLEAMFGTLASIELVLQVLPRPTLDQIVGQMGWPSRDASTFRALEKRAHALTDALDLTREADLRLAANLLARFPDEARVLRTVSAIYQRPWSVNDEDLHALTLEIEGGADHRKYIELADRGKKLPKALMHVWRRFQLDGYEGLSTQLAMKLSTTTLLWLLREFWMKFHTRHLVAPMLSLFSKKEFASIVEQWLLNEGANAIVGLFETATGKGSKKEVAKKFLSIYVDRGHGDLVARLLSRQPDRVKKALISLQKAPPPASLVEVDAPESATIDTEHSESLPDATPLAIEWPSSIEGVPAPVDLPSWLSAIPAWWSTRGEPVPETIERALRALLDTGVTYDRHATQGQRIILDARLQEIIERLDLERAAHVAQALIEVHAREGWKPINRWALNAFAVFPSFDAITFLAKELRGRVGAADRNPAKAHAAEVLGCIDRVDARAAMVRLDRSNVGDVRAAAEQWSQQEFEPGQGTDLQFQLSSTPRCDLDPQGCATFDLGVQVYSARLIDLDAIELKDAHGHTVTTLPVRVDPTGQAQRERARFKRMKEMVTEVAFDARSRVEARSEISWPIDTWRSLFVDHPILVHVARSFLWQVKDGPHAGAVVRLGEDRSLSDMNDDLVSYESLSGATLIVATKDAISEENRPRWRTLLSSYRQVRLLSWLDS
jgi:hypothetical protein